MPGFSQQVARNLEEAWNNPQIRKVAAKEGVHTWEQFKRRAQEFAAGALPGTVEVKPPAAKALPAAADAFDAPIDAAKSTSGLGKVAGTAAAVGTTGALLSADYSGEGETPEVPTEQPAKDTEAPESPADAGLQFKEATLTELPKVDTPQLKHVDSLAKVQDAMRTLNADTDAAIKMYREERSQLKRRQLWEKITNAVTYIVAGAYGLKQGLNMGGLKLDETDWYAEMQEARDNLNEEMGAAKTKFSSKQLGIEAERKDVEGYNRAQVEAFNAKSKLVDQVIRTNDQKIRQVNDENNNLYRKGMLDIQEEQVRKQPDYSSGGAAETAPARQARTQFTNALRNSVTARTGTQAQAQIETAAQANVAYHGRTGKWLFPPDQFDQLKDDPEALQSAVTQFQTPAAAAGMTGTYTMDQVEEAATAKAAEWGMSWGQARQRILDKIKKDGGSVKR